MSKYFVNFIQDVCNQSGIYSLVLDEEYNIWYSSNDRNFIIPHYDIEKYYNSYLMSNQKRDIVVKRAANYVKRLIEKRQEKWNRYDKIEVIRENRRKKEKEKSQEKELDTIQEKE